MTIIYQVETDEHRQHVRALQEEYLADTNEKVGAYFGFNFDVAAVVEARSLLPILRWMNHN